MSVFKFLKNRKSKKMNEAALSEKLSLLKPTPSNLIVTNAKSLSGDKSVTPSTDTPTSPTTPTTPTIRFAPSNDTKITLAQLGYVQTKLICKTDVAETIKAYSIKNDMKLVTIKKVHKKYFSYKKSAFAMINGGNQHYKVHKNIEKEAGLLNHCTVSNKANGQINKFIEFFCDHDNFYLVTEYAGDITLGAWVKQAFKYIDAGKLAIREYRTIIKYIFWQISSAIYWLHNDMKMCHLGIKMANIAVQRCEWIENGDGSVSIPATIRVKLCNFSTAKVFKNPLDNGLLRDATIDVWAMGILLFQMAFGRNPFQSYNESDVGYLIIKRDQLDYYIRMHNLVKYATPSMIRLICGMLKFDESKRLDSLKIIQCEWLQNYWQKYKIRIARKSLTKKVPLPNGFPYYM